MALVLAYGSSGYLVRAVDGAEDLRLQNVGARWVAAQDGWRVHTLEELEALPLALEYTPGALARAREERQRTEALCALQRADDADVAHGEGLDPYQRVGVRFLTVAGRAILADGLGLGKSAQAIRAAREAGAKRVLVITKKSLLHQWVCEIETWLREGSPDA